MNLEGGVPPVHEPPDPESCRDWIRERDRAGDAVLILGGGGQWFLGNEPERATHILSVRRWARILDHSPGDLTVTVEAGCPLERLQKTLSEAGQFLPFRPPNYRHSTIGGAVATALAGRYGPAVGGMREHLIGIEILHADGRLSHAGGRVVKNVAGYDLCKLYAGSMGTLGIITHATFKVRPLPPASRTGVLEFDRSERVAGDGPFLAQPSGAGGVGVVPARNGVPAAGGLHWNATNWPSSFEIRRARSGGRAGCSENDVPESAFWKPARRTLSGRAGTGS